MRISHQLTLVVALVLACLLGWAAWPGRATGAAAFATITVTTTADENNTNPAACSLREAITAANTNAAFGGCAAGMAGLDNIIFALGTGTPSIGVTGSPLPTITEPVNINGNTGGATRVELNGAGAGGGANGLTITGGGSTISALVINRFGLDGILITGDGNVVQNSLIGTDVTGTMGLGNSDDGVQISGGATKNTIGGMSAGARNVISGNGYGVYIVDVGTSGNLVQGNFIGTDVTGTMDLGNGVDGVLIDAGAANNTIGGTSAAARNIISGNRYGVEILDVGTSGNLVQGNFIGTDVTGTMALGNGNDGVQISGGAVNNTIGGTSAGARNIISDNGGGVLIDDVGTSGNLVQGNFIGTDVTGTMDLGNAFDGVEINRGATNNTIGGTSAAARNIISGNDSNGVSIDDFDFSDDAETSGNLVQGNFIGTDVTGTMDLGNEVTGVWIIRGAANNTIGGTSAAARNIISGNGYGVSIEDPGTSGNLVQGNFIGTDVTGTMDLGNEFDGVDITLGATNNTIGGTSAGARNVISGNGGDGVIIFDAGTDNNLVQGNFIGTNAAGTSALGNVGDGVDVQYATNNTIGGTIGLTPGACTGACNLIAFNGDDGVDITTDLAQTTISNAILGNSIHSNVSLGIDLEAEDIDIAQANDGLTPNDPGDPDVGANNYQNFPLLTCAQSANGQTAIRGSFNSLPSTSFRVEFFANAACDPSGFGEGQIFLGFQNVTTDASGSATINASLAAPVASGQVVTATATRLDAMSNPVETSEFSACLANVFTPTVSINDVSVTEGNAGTTNAVFTITVSNAMGVCLPITVNYATQDGTATGPGDFTPTASSITFSPPFAGNTLTQTITVPVVGDTAFEPNETFFVNIAAINATVTDNQGQGTIINDDAATSPLGPGLPFPDTSEVSDQKAGSVLVYNLYSSSAAAPQTQNTRLSITNTNPTLDVAVRLFFVDGANCSVADALICLTQNQTASFLASDLDPGTTGYVVAVASDPTTGCPINFNFLIGDEYVKLASGHAANLGAEAFAAIAAAPVACDGFSVAAQLNFDGASYNRAPRTLAASSIPARADGNDTLLVINRFGGNLAIGAATLTNLFGIFYDDAETGLSFSFNPGVCQFRSSLSSNFPRTTPRLETFIPAGRSGWLRLYSASDIGLLGAVLNFNPTAGAAAGAFNQGRNLHKLTLTSTQTLIIPTFPANCQD